MASELQSHFGLNCLPFTREVAVGQHWEHEQFIEAKASLREVIEDRMSGALIAPAGSGKTQVLRGLVDRLPAARFTVHSFKVNGISKRDFCRHLAHAVGAKPAGHTAALVTSLQERFGDLVHLESRRPVLLIDEAHDLRPEVLKLLRVMTNFEMDSKLVLSVILCGQPPLRQMLARAEMEAISRRLAVYCSLRTLDRRETRRYVEHRLAVAGAASEVVSPSGYEAIFECSQGNLRACDRIALASLKLAARRKENVVDAELVGQARASVLP